ncbi:unnamed protein product [Camellia sinensis]
MNDLLSSSFEIPRGQGTGGDIEMGRHRPMNSGELGLDNFFKQVQDIEKQYEALNKLLKKLQDAHVESKAVTKAAAMKSIKQRMEKDVDEVGKVARFIKSKIEELDRDNLTNRQKPGCGKGTGVDRSRTATTVALKKKFKDKMSEFQTLRQNIHQEYRDVVERRVFTVTGTRADEEVKFFAVSYFPTIDQLIETGDSEQIFQKAIREQGRGQIMDTLAEIQERHDAVRDVERKLLELQQIFLYSNRCTFNYSPSSGLKKHILEISFLKEKKSSAYIFGYGSFSGCTRGHARQHRITCNGNNLTEVSSAVDHVQSGNTALQKAKKLQRNSRKWMCIAIMILLIIVVVVVVGVLKPWSTNKGA